MISLVRQCRMGVTSDFRQSLKRVPGRRSCCPLLAVVWQRSTASTREKPLDWWGVLVWIMTVRSPYRIRFPFILPLVALLAACLPSFRRSPSNPVLARRLVLALDGVDYRDIVRARERGLFGSFRPPSRLISTFPSISDISWHEIFGVQPPRGYQRIFYSAAHNEVVGAALDAIRPIEFEDRMDMAFGAKFHHLGAYLISNTIAKHEVDVAVGDFFKFSGRSTVYVYNVGPDALQHTRGDLDKYLAHLDKKLIELQHEYRERTGTPLEIVVLSDHGHNRAEDAKFLPVVKALQARGFRVAEQLNTPNDVAFSVDGVTTGFGVFCARDSVVSLADLLASLDGVDVVTREINDSTFHVIARQQTARIERRRTRTGDRFRYVALEGDPLGYASIVAQMKRDRGMDADGFADSPTWIRYTAGAKYPAAPERIARGHTVVTLNPAPILVSLSDDYRVGLGMVSIANRMRPLGGTHGALSETNAVGILMTNFRDTRDDITTYARAQLNGFSDLGPVRYKSSGARLTNTWLISHDTRGPFRVFPDTLLASTPSAAVEVWLTTKTRTWAGERAAFFLELRKLDDNKRQLPNSLVTTSYLPLKAELLDSGAPQWLVGEDQLHFALPLSRIGVGMLEPLTNYEIRVVLDRTSAQGADTRAISREIETISLRTTARGELWPY